MCFNLLFGFILFALDLNKSKTMAFSVVIQVLFTLQALTDEESELVHIPCQAVLRVSLFPPGKERDQVGIEMGLYFGVHASHPHSVV